MNNSTTVAIDSKGPNQFILRLQVTQISVAHKELHEANEIICHNTIRQFNCNIIRKGKLVTPELKTTRQNRKNLIEAGAELIRF